MGLWLYTGILYTGILYTGSFLFHVKLQPSSSSIITCNITSTSITHDQYTNTDIYPLLKHMNICLHEHILTHARTALCNRRC